MIPRILQQARGEDPKFNKDTALMMSATSLPLLFVEGDPDKVVIVSLFTDFPENQILISGGKDDVKACLKTAIEKSGGNKALYRGLVDNDIDSYRKTITYIYDDCLFRTETRDMETFLWSTDRCMFRSLLLRGGLKNELKYEKTSEWEVIFEKITEAAYKLGIVRLIVEESKYSRMHMKINQPADEKGKPIMGTASPYDGYYNEKDMTMDIPMFIENYLCCLDKYKTYRYEIEDEYEAQYKSRTAERWKIIRGHDLSTMMMKTINEWMPENRKWKNLHDFECETYKHFQSQIINRTKLWAEIHTWMVSAMPATA